MRRLAVPFTYLNLIWKINLLKIVKIRCTFIDSYPWEAMSYNLSKLETRMR